MKFSSKCDDSFFLMFVNILNNINYVMFSLLAIRKVGFSYYFETFCWRAIARQHTILYNRAKSAKFVGCKIGDMRSRFRF